MEILLISTHNPFHIYMFSYAFLQNMVGVVTLLLSLFNTCDFYNFTHILHIFLHIIKYIILN